MKKQLDYFEIEGEFGGNQDWFTNVVMHIGGCAAATACDSCIYFAREKGWKELYPFNPYELSKQDYKSFSMKMKPYLKPRKGGVDKLDLYIEGLENYLQDVEKIHMPQNRHRIHMEPFSGENSCEKAWEVIKKQINAGYPIPYLLLRHEDTEQFKDFIWHWFLLVGYEEKTEESKVKKLVTAATYGQATTFALDELWQTGREPKGGMILYATEESEIAKVTDSVLQ